MPKSARQIFEEIQTLIKNSNNNQLKIESEKPITIIMKQKILCGIDGFEQGTAELLDYIQTKGVRGGLNKTNCQNSNFSIYKSNQRKAFRYQMVISTGVCFIKYLFLNNDILSCIQVKTLFKTSIRHVISSSKASIPGINCLFESINISNGLKF
jgi:hypothetical protein